MFTWGDRNYLLPHCSCLLEGMAIHSIFAPEKRNKKNNPINRLNYEDFRLFEPE